MIIDVDELGRLYRFGVPYYTGHSLSGEFFEHKDRFVLLGFWFDL